MTTKKYSMRKVPNSILYRIKALKDLPLYKVKKGDLGGFIEKEWNLSQQGECWVHNEAQVYGDARVYGNAIVYGSAKVSGSASIIESAQVYGDARVLDDAQVQANARVYGDARVSDYASLSGKARAYGNAQVYANSQVYGNAEVLDDARVYGEAQVYGDARVYGKAQVYGEAQVYGKATVAEQHYIQYGRLEKDITKLQNLKEHLMSVFNVHISKSKITLYKRVNKKTKSSFTSIYDPNFIYQKNKIKKVKFSSPINPNVICGEGIHLSHLCYWSEGDTTIICEVALKDIISCQGGKIRAKQCKVVGVVE